MAPGPLSSSAGRYADRVETTKVAVIGAAGRMGAEVCRAVTAADDLELVGRYDQGDELGDLGGADVVVEFSVPAASPGNVAHCIEQGVHVVVGTTGWDDARLSALEEPLAAHPEVGVLIAPNFAIGAILMMRFASIAAPFYESVEVVELHHPDKADAPSGSWVVASGTSPRPASERAAAISRAVRAAVPDGASTLAGWCSSITSTDS